MTTTITSRDIPLLNAKTTVIETLYVALINNNFLEISRASVENIKKIFDFHGNNAVQIAYNANSINIVNYLIDNEKFINCEFEIHKNKRNETLFHLAVHRNDFVLINKLEVKLASKLHTKIF